MSNVVPGPLVLDTPQTKKLYISCIYFIRCIERVEKHPDHFEDILIYFSFIELVKDFHIKLLVYACNPSVNLHCNSSVDYLDFFILTDFYFFEVMQADLLDCVWTAHYVFLNTMNRKSFKLWQELESSQLRQKMLSRYSSKYLQKFKIEVVIYIARCCTSIMNLWFIYFFLIKSCVYWYFIHEYICVPRYGNCQICNFWEGGWVPNTIQCIYQFSSMDYLHEI